MQNKKKNILSLSLIVALLAVIVGGTYAYFTDEKEVTNTFTVGDVKIELDEAEVERVENEFVKQTERTDKGVEYKNIYPGAELPKDPTVTLKAGSEDSYIFMQLNNNASDYLEIIEINSGWSLVAESENVYVYQDIVQTTEDQLTKLPALFNKVEVKTELSRAQLLEIESLDIQVKAFAIQAEGFETAEKAWEALNAQLDGSL